MAHRQVNRRGFMKKTVLASAGAAAAMSLEEQILLAAEKTPARPAKAAAKGMPTGKIGKLTISRIICGGNLISGFAHSRDLVYVSALLRHYFTDEKVFATLEACEANGINTAILRLDDRTIGLLEKYRKRGGKIQWIAQIKTRDSKLTRDAQKAIDHGAVGAYVQGGVGDRLVADGKTEILGQFVEYARSKGVIGGIGGHTLAVPMACEKAGVEADFYMKTLHGTSYWSHSSMEGTHDNVWAATPDKTIAFMNTVAKPWIAFKVLAAGAINPTVGFKYAFRGGADFACVGMFDFQVAQDARILKGLFARGVKRPRPWRA